MAATILQRIVGTKREEVALARTARPMVEVQARARSMEAARDFYAAVTATSDQARLIAEIKKASPSAGLIRSEFDPAGIARVYARCGAAALSVLTDRVFFQGEIGFIELVKAAVVLPVLRKDFVIDAYQVVESRAAGADAILLIAAILERTQVEEYSALAFELGMTTLIEVHDAAELETVGAFVGSERRSLLGINNRNLATQQIDLATTTTLAVRVPAGAAFVAESGLKTREDVMAMQDAGASAVLIGETFMRAPEVAAKVHELMGHSAGGDL
ncbi:MAG: indole-3-glycerol phosphate synthase TrpC [Planctomycetota bacterium]